VPFGDFHLPRLTHVHGRNAELVLYHCGPVGHQDYELIQACQLGLLWNESNQKDLLHPTFH
jgi:hypothetical protein